VQARRAAGTATVLAAGYWSPAAALVSQRVRRLLGVHARVVAGDAVALTFDDGPHPQGTPAVLELLAREGVSATFFLVGEQVRRGPRLAAEIVAAGHDVALHCDRHRNLLRLTPRQARADLERAREAIEAAAGRPVRCYRPPYGILTTPALLGARRHGWQTVLWTRHGADWAADATPAAIAGQVLRRARGGDVLLLHDADDYSAPGSWRRTVAALPRLLEGLCERRLELTALQRTAP
jgi:peptidoglycan/xylan/chitin deacetylase (PgdA/CDA1 family)